MVELHWPRETTFLAPSGQYSGPGTHDVPDDMEEAFRDRGWEDPPEAEGESESDGEDDSDSGETEPPDGTEIDPSDYTLDELEDALDGTDADAEALHERESEGDDRVGAHEIIDAVAGE